MAIHRLDKDNSLNIDKWVKSLKKNQTIVELMTIEWMFLQMSTLKEVDNIKSPTLDR